MTTLNHDTELEEILFKAAGGISDMAREEIKALHTYLYKQTLELAEEARGDKYEKHKACDHETDIKWGTGYNDACFDIERAAAERYGIKPDAN